MRPVKQTKWVKWTIERQRPEAARASPRSSAGSNFLPSNVDTVNFVHI
jgi:hypothetical protein